MTALTELLDRPDLGALCLGGNVFGWTADEPASFAVLDAFVEAGGSFIDTADSYSAWHPGNVGGESERVIGRWMVARGNRDQLVIATKVGSLAGYRGLSAANISAAVEQSLTRLQTDRIDLYFAHQDDPRTPQLETQAAFDTLVRQGKVRIVGASNFSPERLAEALAVSDREGLVRYAAVQPRWNLLEREIEAELVPLMAREDLACLPYAALAGGFLTGKYAGGATVDSPRAQSAGAYAGGRGDQVVAALQSVAAAHGTTAAAVAVAWLRAQPTVLAPLVSARSPEQLAEVVPAMHLTLSREELELLSGS